MTQEQARLILQENFGLLSFEYPGKISEAIKTAIEVLSQPSLPSNLDEAADKYIDTVEPACVMEGDYTMSDIYHAFKAGAEWMAKQGVSMEVVRGVPWRAVDAFIHDHDYTEDSIIQIRKK